MTDSEKLRRFGFDKIALLVLLLVGFLFAELIVLSQSRFKLSKPVSLPGCGLAVSVPAGGGFSRLSDGFRYNDNEFRLTCIRSDAAMSINWRYFIVPFEKTVDEKFHAQASDMKGVIEKTGSEKLGQFTFDYARIFSEKKATLLFSGIVLLPDGRTLSLEVAQKGRNIDPAEKIFRSLAASATFTPASPLADGRELLDNFRLKTLADIFQKNTRQNYYYIKDYTGRNLGFITDAISLKNNRRDANSLTAVSLYFIHSGINSFAERSLFHSEPNLRSFRWVSQQSNLLINRDLTTSLKLDQQGMITVLTSATSVPQKNIMQKFAFTSTMLPEILFNAFIEGFQQSSFNSVMVDLILSDSRITPALLTRARPQEDAEPNAAPAVEIAFFGTDTSEQTTYFDSDGKISLSEARGKLSYKLEKTQRDLLVADFPAWLEKLEVIEQYVNEKSKD